VIPALGQHRHIDDHADAARRVVRENRLAGVGCQIAVDQRGGNVRCLERVGDVFGMGDGGTEDDGLPVARLFRPVADHLVGDGGAVHDARDLHHVEIREGFADRPQLVLHAHIDDEGAWRDQMARGDQFAQPHLVGDIVEDLAQALPVAPVRRRRDPEDAGIGIGVPHPINDAAVAVGDGMVRLVDDQQVETRHVGEVRGARQRRHHGEGDLAAPRFLRGVDDRCGDARHHALELGAVLRGQLVAMRQHAGLGTVADHLAGDRRQHHGLASTGGCHAQRVAAGGERSHTALDEGLLAGAQAHGRSLPLTAPSSAARGHRGGLLAGSTKALWSWTAAGHAQGRHFRRTAAPPSP